MQRVLPENLYQSDRFFADEPLRQGRSGDGHKGIFVAVAGPSGAGKDSLISSARAAMAADRRYVFVRRVVTRASSSHEDHDTLPEGDFRFRAETGGFALWWQANDLFYGLPAAIIDDLAQGHVVVANISRDVIDLARHRFPRSLIVHVTASPEVLGMRLAVRAREQVADQKERLSRSLLREQAVEADVRIENNGSLQDAASTFISILTSLVPRLGSAPRET